LVRYFFPAQFSFCLFRVCSEAVFCVSYGDAAGASDVVFMERREAEVEVSPVIDRKIVRVSGGSVWIAIPFPAIAGECCSDWRCDVLADAVDHVDLDLAPGELEFLASESCSQYALV
jgi:hypothetical protein